MGSFLTGVVAGTVTVVIAGVAADGVETAGLWFRLGCAGTARTLADRAASATLAAGGILIAAWGSVVGN